MIKKFAVFCFKKSVEKKRTSGKGGAANRIEVMQNPDKRITAKVKTAADTLRIIHDFPGLVKKIPPGPDYFFR